MGPETSSGRRLFRFDLHEQLTFGDLCTGLGRKLGNRPVEGRGQAMLHLHCFKGEQALPLSNLFTLLDFDRGDLARHRRLDLAIMEAVTSASAIAASGNRNSFALIKDVQTSGGFF